MHAKKAYWVFERQHVLRLADIELNRTMPANCQRRIHTAVLLQWSVVMKS